MSVLGAALRAVGSRSEAGNNRGTVFFVLEVVSLSISLLAAEGGYLVERTTASRDVLLQGEEGEWREAGRLIFGPSRYRTSFRALWSDEGLFVRFDVSDPEPWHTMTRRDDPLWEEEVVEVFLDLDGSGTHYAEVELSPANVVCDVRMIRGAPGKEMDLEFDVEGLVSRAIQDPEHQSWTGLLFLPWQGFTPLPSASKVSLPPQDGDRWRFNVYRIERPHGKRRPLDDVVFASWYPTGSESFHVPESFQTLEFALRD